MSLIASSRSGAHAPPNHHAAGDTSTSPPTDDVDAALPLPRHLLVALAAIAADITSLRAQAVDEPQLHQPLDRILGKLDGLVDDIYEQAARPRNASNQHHPAIATAAVPARNGQRHDSGAQRPF